MGTKLSTVGAHNKESKRIKEQELYFQYKLKQVDISIAKLDVKICDCEEGENSGEGEDSPKLLKLKMIYKELIASSQKLEKKIYKFDRGQLYKTYIRKEFEEKQIDVSTLDPKIIRGYTECGKLKDFQEMKQKLIKQKEQWIYENTPEGKRDLQNQKAQQFEKEQKLAREHEEFWRRKEIQERQLFNKWGRCPICHKMLGPFMAKYEQFNDNYEDYQINYNRYFKLTIGRTEIVNHPWQLRCRQESLMLLNYLTDNDWVQTPIGGIGHERFNLREDSVNYQNLYGKFPSDLILPPKVLNKSEQKRWIELIESFKNGTATRTEHEQFKNLVDKERHHLNQMFRQHGEDCDEKILVSTPGLYVDSESHIPIEDDKIKLFHQLTDHYYQNNKSVYNYWGEEGKRKLEERILEQKKVKGAIPVFEMNDVLLYLTDNFFTDMSTLHYEVTEIDYLPVKTVNKHKINIVKVKGPKILYHSRCIGLWKIHEEKQILRAAEKRIEERRKEGPSWLEQQSIKTMEHRQEEIRAKEYRRKMRIGEYAPDWARPRHEKYLPKPIDYWQPVSHWN